MRIVCQQTILMKYHALFVIFEQELVEYFDILSVFKRATISLPMKCHLKIEPWDFQQCGLCDKQSLRSACAYAHSDQSLF